MAIGALADILQPHKGAVVKGVAAGVAAPTGNEVADRHLIGGQRDAVDPQQPVTTAERKSFGQTVVGLQPQFPDKRGRVRLAVSSGSPAVVGVVVAFHGSTPK